MAIKNLLHGDWTLYVGAGMGTLQKLGVAEAVLTPTQYYLWPEGDEVNIAVHATKSYGGGNSADTSVPAFPGQLMSVSFIVMTNQPTFNLTVVTWSSLTVNDSRSYPVAKNYIANGGWQLIQEEFICPNNALYISPSIQLKGGKHDNLPLPVLGVPVYVADPVLIVGSKSQLAQAEPVSKPSQSNPLPIVAGITAGLLAIGVIMKYRRR